MHVTVGIDPGYFGAVAILVTAEEMEVHDIPRRPGTHGDYDLEGMVGLLLRAAELADGGEVTVVLERPLAVSGQGVASLAKQARGAALWEGMAAALGWPCVVGSPSTWKRALGIKAATAKERKAASLALARERFPALEPMLRRVRDHGRAEALLIAWWGRP